MCGRDIEKSIEREMSGDLESGMLAVGKDYSNLFSFKPHLWIMSFGIKPALHGPLSHPKRIVYYIDFSSGFKVNVFSYVVVFLFFCNISQGYGTVTCFHMSLFAKPF